MKKVAVITGGFGSIGYTIATDLAKAGYAIAILSRTAESENNKEKFENLPTEDKLVITCDAANANDLEYAKMQILRTFGSLDVLVNCAGWSKFVAHDDFETLDTIFDDVIEHNLITVYKSIRVFSDSFKDDSIIVNISSAAAKGRGGSNIAYAAAKAGVDSLTRNLSAVLGPKTRVVAIAPGFVETAFKRPDQAAVAEVTPLKRVATVNDVSEAVLNVINTKFLNGSSIVLDGGRIV